VWGCGSAGTVEHADFMGPWQSLPETIYARPLVQPGDKVRPEDIGAYSPCHGNLGQCLQTQITDFCSCKRGQVCRLFAAMNLLETCNLTMMKGPVTVAGVGLQQQLSAFHSMCVMHSCRYKDLCITKPMAPTKPHNSCMSYALGYTDNAWAALLLMPW